MSTCWDMTITDISSDNVNKLKKTITILITNQHEQLQTHERVHEVQESVCSNCPDVDSVNLERGLRYGENQHVDLSTHG
jgi:hypothetical protein